MSDAGRWLDRDALARHISVRVDYLPRLVKAGKLPAPSYHLGPKTPRWDRALVDAQFTNDVSCPDLDARVQELADEIAAAGRRRH